MLRGSGVDASGTASRPETAGWRRSVGRAVSARDDNGSSAMILRICARISSMLGSDAVSTLDILTSILASAKRNSISFVSYIGNFELSMRSISHWASKDAASTEIDSDAADVGNRFIIKRVA